MLDVFRPLDTPETAKLPVAVWIYGGGFVLGQTSIYDATDLIVRSIVRVSHPTTHPCDHTLTIRQDTPFVYIQLPPQSPWITSGR